MKHITKEDFKNDKYYLKLIVMYTVILMIVYTYLFIVLKLPLWSIFLIAFSILFLGALIFILRLSYVSKKRINSLKNGDE